MLVETSRALFAAQAVEAARGAWGAGNGRGFFGDVKLEMTSPVSLSQAEWIAEGEQAARAARHRVDCALWNTSAF